MGELAVVRVHVGAVVHWEVVPHLDELLDDRHAVQWLTSVLGSSLTRSGTIDIHMEHRHALPLKQRLNSEVFTVDQLRSRVTSALRLNARSYMRGRCSLSDTL